MPFQNPPSLFTREDAIALKPGQKGIYGLYRSDPSGPTWSYIGKGDIRTRLIGHLKGDNLCILKEGPTHFVTEVIMGDPSEREKELIQELNPICN